MVSYKLKDCIVDSIERYGNLTRKFDNQIPYFIHPLWCGMTILSETNLPEKLREIGSLTLLYHDVLEESLHELPSYLPEEVKRYVKLMTYEHFNDEVEDISNQPKEIKLFRLYDKVSNILDSSWMSVDKKKKYMDYINYLTEEVRKNYGDLNIVKIAEIFLIKFREVKNE